MSDIRQQIIDELKEYGYDGIIIRGVSAIDIVEKHLETMAIVPVEPTEAMVDAGNDMNEAGGEAESIFTHMLNSFKGQS